MLFRSAMPNLTVKELGRPAAEVAKKDFAVISKETTLAEAVRKFKETKCEILVVQDKSGKVIGTISPTDLLYCLEGAGNHNART